eukprot:COSAG01_NODE_72452_length_253_cov_0.532468_1_plen_24_part_01
MLWPSPAVVYNWEPQTGATAEIGC